MRALIAWAPALLLVLPAAGLAAATILVQPGDSGAKMEAARAGDVVLIAPGTYAFRLYLTAQAPATNPIVIQALDPAHPPVWDFGATPLDAAPGSYHAGDRGRGAWQFSGASGYQLSGLIFRNCRNGSRNAAGVRYYNGSSNLWIRGCAFTQNDNGLTGGTEDSSLSVEGCEFYANGNAAASSPTHNVYIYGGTFLMRGCHLHDSVQAQNFHVRAREAVLEYNWIANAKSYEGDLMTDDDSAADPAHPYDQRLTLRGNVFVTGGTAQNHGQIVAIYNDTSAGAPPRMSVRALYNTVVADGGHAAFIHLSNADGTPMEAEISDNIVSGTTQPYLVEDAAAGAVAGVNNWLETNALAGALTGSIRSSSPGFRGAAAGQARDDYSLAPASPCLGKADWTVYGLPGFEYWAGAGGQAGPGAPGLRPRAAARDPGAFESSTVTTVAGPPEIVLAGAHGNLVASWPLYASDYGLQSTASLGKPEWAPFQGVLRTNATGVSATVTPGGGALLLRLAR